MTKKMAKAPTEVVLERLRTFYKHTVDSNQYTEWRKNARQAWDFYDGKQWTDQEERALLNLNQVPVVINELAPRIDSVVGAEVQSRTKVGYQPRSTSMEDKMLAEALTIVSTQVQEMNDAAEIKSSIFKSGLVCGVGCLELRKQDDGTIKLVEISDDEVLYDPDAVQSDMRDSMYIGRSYLADIDEVIKTYPDKKDQIESFVASAKERSGASHFMSGSDEYDPDNYREYYDDKRNKMRIVKIQYKKPITAYRFFDTTGKEKETFDKDTAQKFATEEAPVVEVTKNQIWEGVFSADIVLKHMPTDVQNGEFTQQLFVYKRRNRDGVPYGNVYPAIHPQRELNKRRSKMLHYLNVRRVVADANAFENPDEARQEAGRPDAFMLKRRGTEVQMTENLSLADSQFQLMQESKREIQAVTGIYDEFMGRQTNASSGVAISQRANNTERSQSHVFSKLRFFSKQFGRSLLSMIQASMTQPVLVEIADPENSEKMKTIILNEVVETEGEEVVVRDISTGIYDVVVTEEPNYDAPPEAIRESLIQILGNGQLQVLGVPELAKILIPHGSEQISAGVQQLLGASQPQAGAQEAAGVAATNTTP
tara:strand:+ start:3220 stop:5001 length:1782 start_codon:yes stop_codon:yes gene_type:complete